MFKNVASQKLAVYAWDSANSVPKTGDSANITAYISKDGAAVAQSNDANPTELDATNAKGIYLFDITQAESNCDLFVISPVSATADIQIESQIIYTNPENFTALGIEADGDLTKVNLCATTTTNTDMLTVADVLTTQMTEAYAADGTAPTLAQALFLIQQSLHEFAIVDTTRTVKKLDGSTSAATFTLDDASSPTSTTRAS